MKTTRQPRSRVKGAFRTARDYVRAVLASAAIASDLLKETPSTRVDAVAPVPVYLPPVAPSRVVRVRTIRSVHPTRPDVWAESSTVYSEPVTHSSDVTRDVRTVTTLPDGIDASEPVKGYSRAMEIALARSQWRASPIYRPEPVHVCRIDAPETEEEKRERRAFAKRERNRIREQNSHVPTPTEWIETLRHRCRALAGKLVDRLSGKGHAYASTGSLRIRDVSGNMIQPGDEAKRASVVHAGRHRAKGGRAVKLWDYLRHEVAEEMFGEYLYALRRITVFRGEQLGDGAIATQADEQHSLRLAETQESYLWPQAYRAAQALFHKMARAPREEFSTELHQVSTEEARANLPQSASRDRDTLAKQLAAYYLAKSPRNAETLLRADLAAVDALSAGIVRLDAKGNAFAKFLRLAKRAEEGAKLLGASSTRAPVKASSTRRQSGRPALMTV